jgi:hypothetical protein
VIPLSGGRCSFDFNAGIIVLRYFLSSFNQDLEKKKFSPFLSESTSVTGNGDF